jgi:hypothetical protein
MIPARTLLARFLFCVCVATVGLTPTTAQADESKEVAWKEIVGKANQAFNLLSAETVTVNSSRQHDIRLQRTSAFRDLAKATYDWRSKYLSDKAGLAYLEATFRVGLYEEYGESYLSAEGLYYDCSEHPERNNPAALYNGKPILVLARSHYLAIQSLFQTVRQNGQNPNDVQE